MSQLEEQIEIANPQHPHCATVLLLDTSRSMAGEKIKGLNDGIKLFKDDISSDELASRRIDLAVVSFADTTSVVHQFSSIDDFEPPVLKASGSTAMGEAILRATDLVEQRKEHYKQQGIDYFRPWVFLITDGGPTDMKKGDAKWNEVVKRVRDGEANRKFMFFAVVVEPGNFDLLAQIAPENRPPEKLKGTKFSELFEWLSKSQARVSASSVGEAVKLESPAAAGWAEVSG